MVEGGGGVGVRAESHAEALQPLDQGARREVRASVEGHVLQEMREAALLLGLVEGTREDEEAQRRPGLRLVVRHHGIAYAVRQCSKT